MTQALILKLVRKIITTFIEILISQLISHLMPILLAAMKSQVEYQRYVLIKVLITMMHLLCKLAKLLVIRLPVLETSNANGRHYAVSSKRMLEILQALLLSAAMIS